MRKPDLGPVAEMGRRMQRMMPDLSDDMLAARAQYFLYLFLSVSLAQKLGMECVVHTDDFGRAMLMRYGVGVDTVFISMDGEDLQKWGLAKMKTIADLSEPALHIDHDVFLLKRQRGIPDADLVVQNFEDPLVSPKTYPFYEAGLEDYRADAGEIPPALKWLEDSGEPVAGWNCGYLEVHDVGFARKWAGESIETFKPMKTFVHHNNIIAEQAILFAAGQRDGVAIRPLFRDLSTEPEIAGYVHLMGAKKRDRVETIVERVMARLWEADPALAGRVRGDYASGKFALA